MWGSKTLVLEQYEKQFGKTPQAILDKPDLPWYYSDIFNHYMLLSNKRGKQVITTYKVVKNQIVPTSKLLPKEIDTNSILLLAKSAGIMNPVDFLELVSELDSMYIKKAMEKVND